MTGKTCTDRQGTKVKFAGAGNEDEHGQSQ